jgi:hypothetical protein
MRLTIASGERRELICPSCQLVADIFACDVGQITGTSSRIPRFLRGAFRDRHGRWAREAMDASGAKDECAVTRTAKSCGPDASTLAFKLSTMLRIATATVTRSPIAGEQLC